MSEPRRTRMFPLSSVLMPRGILPLHVFEPRYLTMISEAIADDGLIGVVLIERGWEVGGGDARFGVGTTARIVRAGILEEDRMAVVTVGEERFDIVDWLEDDPYPVAMTVARDDDPTTSDLEPSVAEAMRAWRRVAALASELGADVGSADLELPDDPIDGTWVLASVSPLEQIDRQRILETDDPAERVNLLRTGLEDQAETLQARLAGGLS